MHALVVHAHPNPESFNATLFRLVCDTLRAKGHTVDALDLYAEGFDPVMTRQERHNYLADPHRKLLLRGLLSLFARRCKTSWLQLHNMNNVTPSDRAVFIERVRRHFNRL